MDRKIVMLLIGIVAIGMFALPSTLAMYSGQHDFIEGSNVSCSKCHGAGDDIGAELAGSDMHVTLGCADCHGFGVATPNGVSDGSMGHAATVDVTCVGCHFEGTTFAPDLDADAVSVVDELNNGAHDVYYANMTDQDDACIGCHTSVAVAGKIGAGGTEGPIDLTAYNY